MPIDPSSPPPPPPPPPHLRLPVLKPEREGSQRGIVAIETLFAFPSEQSWDRWLSAGIQTFNLTHSAVWESNCLRGGNLPKDILGAFPYKWRGRQREPWPWAGRDLTKPGSQAASAAVGSNHPIGSLCFIWGDEKGFHWNGEVEQNCACQSKFGVWLESAARCCVPSHRAVFRSVFSPLPHTRLLRRNKEAFHTDLDTQPPPSPQEPAQRNPPQLPDINLCNLGTHWSSQRRKMHIMWWCFYSNHMEK